MANPRIELEAYVDKSDFDKKIVDMNQRLDKLSAAYKKQGADISAAAKQSTMSWTDFRSAYSTVLDVIRVGQQVWTQTVDVAQQYDQTVRDMMLSTGGTAEETSKLIQVVDDVGVSYGTLKTALKIASKEGIEPNIESLAKLSDEYVKLQPGVERNQFLMEKFGRSGMDMARAMEQGGDALRKMSSEMEGGLVLTQKAIDESEEYRKNVDELSDSWMAFKVSLGNAVIPAINDTIQAQNDFAEAYDIVAAANEGATHRTLMYLAEIELERQKSMDAAVAVAAHGEALDGIAESADTATQAIKRGNDEQFSLITQLSDAYRMNAEAHSERTQKILLDMTLEKIAMLDGEAGFSDAELQKALAVAETAGAVEAAAIRELVAMESVSTAIANGTMEAGKMKSLLQSLTSQNWTVTVAVQMQQLEGLRSSLQSQQASNPNRTYQIGGRASGGPVSANTPYMVGEQGPEMIVPQSSGTVIPNNKLGGGIDYEKMASAITRSMTTALMRAGGQ